MLNNISNSQYYPPRASVGAVNIQIFNPTATNGAPPLDYVGGAPRIPLYSYPSAPFYGNFTTPINNYVVPNNYITQPVNYGTPVQQQFAPSVPQAMPVVPQVMPSPQIALSNPQFITSAPPQYIMAQPVAMMPVMPMLAYPVGANGYNSYYPSQNQTPQNISQHQNVNITYPSNLPAQDSGKNAAPIVEHTQSQNGVPVKSETKPFETETKKEETRKKVILTDDYIKSLEHFLNDPNKKNRLYGATELLERFKEDKTRANDPALVALLNKALQDPSHSVRFVGLTILDVGYSVGNDETVQILKNMQQNINNIYGEDAALASHVLLKLSTETVDVPISTGHWTTVTNNMPKPTATDTQTNAIQVNTNEN